MASSAPLSPSPAASDHHAAASSSSSQSSAHTTPELSNQTASQVSTTDSTAESGSQIEKHPKCPRKRTGPEDKITLEEAYRNDPKPDKKARLDIVRRVSLDEKGVQIWFQNRRQADRRKSKPLTAEEFASLHEESKARQEAAGARLSHPPSARPDPSLDSALASSWASSSPTLLHVSPAMADHGATPSQSGHNSTALVPSCSQQSQSSGIVPQEATKTVGYLANRWRRTNDGSASQSPMSTEGRHESARFNSTIPLSTSSCEGLDSYAPQSRPRLSLSLEGKAELVSLPVRSSGTEMGSTSVRPPLTVPSRRCGLVRSQSARASITLPPIGNVMKGGPLARQMTGRSRDVHAWESCAHPERRDELTAHAENESSGSALAAISLLRSTSGALQPGSAGKRSASVMQPIQAPQPKRAHFGRASTTYARLESALTPSTTAYDAARDRQVKKTTPAPAATSPTDSCKENRTPRRGDVPARTSPSHRTQLPESSSSMGPAQRLRRQVCAVHDQRRPSLLKSGRANTAPSSFKGAAAKDDDVDIYEDPEEEKSLPDDDADVRRFMSGGGGGGRSGGGGLGDISPGKKGALDCAEGLLSLSKGSWK